MTKKTDLDVSAGARFSPDPGLTAVDPFTGEEFHPRSPRHYEAADSVPFAPPVNTPRLSLRERVERLLRGGGQLPAGIYEDDDGADWSEEGEEPLTPAERAELERIAAGDRLQAARDEQARKAAEKPPRKSKESAATPPADPPAEGPGDDPSAEDEQ